MLRGRRRRGSRAHRELGAVSASAVGLRPPVPRAERPRLVLVTDDREAAGIEREVRTGSRAEIERDRREDPQLVTVPEEQDVAFDLVGPGEDAFRRARQPARASHRPPSSPSISSTAPIPDRGCGSRPRSGPRARRSPTRAGPRRRRRHRTRRRGRCRAPERPGSPTPDRSRDRRVRARAPQPPYGPPRSAARRSGPCGGPSRSTPLPRVARARCPVAPPDHARGAARTPRSA